ncbi:hypothetical protein EIP86_005534 [Pleurotus ostreatoroseus]|nr:hypothetical protein EIP86_005534 [Pleurotus ostreatoroseus]
MDSELYLGSNISDELSGRTLESRQRPFGRSTSATALWGHILQKNLPAPLLPQKPVEIPTNPPLAPNDKLGTSVRMLLHDTQATLEKFSERVEKLTSGVDKAQQDIRTVQKLFEHEHENAMEGTVDLVNRCQLEIQKSLGTPAQAHEVEELRKSFVSVDRRLEALDKRFDVLHLLNQTQSQALQAVQEQQVQLMSSIAPILSLLQSIPIRIDSTKFEIKDAIKDVRRTPHTVRNASHSRTSTSSSGTLTAPPKRSSGILPMSSPAFYTPSRKRRRLDTLGNSSQQDRPFPSGSQQSRDLSGLSQPDQSQDMLSCSEPSSHATLSSPFLPQSLSLRRSSSRQLVFPTTPTSTSDQDQRHRLSTSTRAAQLDLPSTPHLPDRRLSKTRSPPTDPEHSAHYLCDRPSSPISLQANILAQHEVSTTGAQSQATEKHPTGPQTLSSINLLATAVPQGVTSPALNVVRAFRRSRTPATLPETLPTTPDSCLMQPLQSTADYCALSPSTRDTRQLNPSTTELAEDLVVNNGLCQPIHGREAITKHLTVEGGTPPSKPMSLKDRRARGLLTNVAMNHSKRYIALDDEEEDELFIE